MSEIRRLRDTARSALHGEPLEVLAKVLTPNDDSGRHGVVIPVEAHSFFPDMLGMIANENFTLSLHAYDARRGKAGTISWKYYERYPERRITRLDPQINEQSLGRRLVVFIAVRRDDGEIVYLVETALEGADDRFESFVDELFGPDVPANFGSFVRLPIDGARFEADDALDELLNHFDRVAGMGWIDSRRTGDTGIGFTFESLLGIGENNDQTADFRGIEIKCKLKRDSSSGVGPASGKINLFQLAPDWLQRESSIDRLRRIGVRDQAGTYSCYSQISTTPNNLGMWLDCARENAIFLQQGEAQVGAWPHVRLAERLAEKHSRAVFVKAERRGSAALRQYRYCELIYCESPALINFVNLVGKRSIVFEFAMTERPPGRVRNHGYPWRMADEKILEQLFAVSLKLR